MIFDLGQWKLNNSICKLHLRIQLKTQLKIKAFTIVNQFFLQTEDIY